MAKRRKGLKPKVRWPAPGKPVEQWSEVELRAVAINPMVTGLGRHPRTVSDEDWVASCMRIMQNPGIAQFHTDTLHVLRVTAAFFVGSPPKPSDYPQVRETEEVPLPNVAHPGDRAWSDEWNEDMVGGILCNPVYAGIPPFPEAVPETQWTTAALKQIDQIGAKQFLSICFMP